MCGPIAGTVDCISDRRGTPCDCTAPICDPFSAQPSIAVCSAIGVVAKFACQDGEVCHIGQCKEPGTFSTEAPPASTAATIDEACAPDTYPRGVFFPRPQLCRSGVFCLADDMAVDAGVRCEEDEYFNGPTASCEPLPVDNCAGCAQATCPDKSDCSRYVICQSGQQRESNKCIESTPFFDATTRQCKVEEEATCDPTTRCKFESQISSTSPLLPTSVGPESTSSSPIPTSTSTGPQNSSSISSSSPPPTSVSAGPDSSSSLSSSNTPLSSPSGRTFLYRARIFQFHHTHIFCLSNRTSSDL